MLDSWMRYRISKLDEHAAGLASALSEHGFALFDGVIDSNHLLQLADSIVTIVPHRDSGPAGITTLTDVGGQIRRGLAGFSACTLNPHTDRSGVVQPPVLLMMSCGKPADSGGECVLVDGEAVYRDLAETCPQVLEALCTPRSVLFGGAGGHLRLHRRQLSLAPRPARVHRQPGDVPGQRESLATPGDRTRLPANQNPDNEQPDVNPKGEPWSRWPHIRRFLRVESSGWVAAEFHRWDWWIRDSAERAAGYEEWAEFYKWRLGLLAKESTFDHVKRPVVEQWVDDMVYLCRQCAAFARREDPGAWIESWQQRKVG